MEPADLDRIAFDAMRTRGLLPEFPPQALQEAEQSPADRAPEGDVRDLRDLPWFAIDNDDTLDVDQLTVAQVLAGGAVRLCVAVADVDSRVAPASAVDTHAAVNTTSVYTAARIFPMLPEKLSTQLTSLREGQERLAVVVDMVVRPDGSVESASLYRAAVFNHAQLTYGAVSAWLDGANTTLPALARVPQLEAQLRLHDDIASRLRGVRIRRGALQVNTVSARPVFENGELVDLRADEKNRAKDLIADLMIAANAETARFLRAAGFPSLRRVLDSPRRWDRIVSLAATHGTALPAQADAPALDAFLCERRKADAAGFADLSLSIVKMLGSGEYAAAAAHGPAPGHFGLAVNDYAHSTAPNRRFADLVTQRLTKAALRSGGAPYDFDMLAAIARQCTLQEDNANKVERSVLKAAAAFLLQGRMGETFDAIVTGAAPKGTYVRITRPLIEGRLVRGFEGADVGDTLRVRLVGLDVQQSHIDFERAA
jgi:exoribonuclease-2